MKLKCNDNRRVMILPTEKVVHRNDGSVCDSKQLTIGKVTLAKPFGRNLASRVQPE